MFIIHARRLSGSYLIPTWTATLLFNVARYHV